MAFVQQSRHELLAHAPPRKPKMQKRCLHPFISGFDKECSGVKKKNCVKSFLNNLCKINEELENRTNSVEEYASEEGCGSSLQRAHTKNFDLIS